MEKKLTYESAFRELKQISAEIENETVSVDQLAEKIKRAAELIGYCQKQLREAETEVNKIIGRMEPK